MRPAYQFTVYLMAVTLFSGCGTTSQSRDDSPRPSGDAVSTGSTKSRSSGSRSGFPAPPPPAPPAYGVSHFRQIGFLRVFDRHHDDGCGTAECGDKCSDSESVCCLRDSDDSCCEPSACGDSCAEGCGSGKKRRLFGCLKNAKCLSLFRCKKCDDDCGDDDRCCLTDSCHDDECADRSCCDPDSCCSSDEGCGGDCGDACEQIHQQPCLADSYENPFIDDAPLPEAQPEQVPAPAVPDVPEAPQPVDPPAQAGLGWPFTGISSPRTSDLYFPSADGQPQNIIEPAPWHGHRAAAADQHHSVTLQRSARTESVTPAYHGIRIQPRQTVE